MFPHIFLRPWANTAPYCFVYCRLGSFPSFLPHDFLFIIVFSPPFDAPRDSSFPPPFTERAFPCDGGLKPSQKTWLNGAAVTERRDFNSIVWQKLHCLSPNPELKPYFPDRNLTHMPVFMAVTCARRERLMQYFYARCSQPHLFAQLSCVRWTLDTICGCHTFLFPFISWVQEKWNPTADRCSFVYSDLLYIVLNKSTLLSV